MRRAVLLLTFALAALASVSAVAAQAGTPTPITNEGDKIGQLWVITLVIAAIVFVAVEGALIWAIIRYRKKSDELPKQTHGSTVIEFIWTGIPIVIVIILFTLSIIVLRDIENEAAPEDLTVRVTGFQFSWIFEYDMNDLGTVNDPNAEGTISIIGTAAQEPTLVIPVGEPVEFALHSPDVIHAFYIRDFLYKLDVVPGRDNRFVVTAHTTGEFFGQCAELCGLDHAMMRFRLRVVTREEFDAWVAEMAPAPEEEAVANTAP
jgi:cytochrome c oxidase subunit 2